MTLRGDGRGARGSEPAAWVMGDLNLVRPLAMAGIRTALVTGDRAAAASRYVAGVVDAASPRLLEDLLARAAAQREKPMLLFQSDDDLEFVCAHRDRLAEGFLLPLAGTDLLRDLLDKERFAAFAERLALPVPPSRRISPSTAREPDELGLAFPVVLKPAPHRTPAWDRLSEGKALRVPSAAALASLWPALRAAGGEFLVQELVEGPETRVVSHHVHVGRDGGVLGEFTGRKIRTRPAELGHSTAVEITDEPDVADLGRELVRRMGLTGVAKLDFKRGPDGRLHLLEVNPRFSLWALPGALAGVNLPALAHAELTGRPARPPVPARAGVRWCALHEDLAAAREAGVSLGSWLRWVSRVEAKSGLSLRDPSPAAQRILGRLRRG